MSAYEPARLRAELREAQCLRDAALAEADIRRAALGRARAQFDALNVEAETARAERQDCEQEEVERRTARSGKDSIGHPENGRARDDVAVVVCLVTYLVLHRDPDSFDIALWASLGADLPTDFTAHLARMASG